MNWYRMKTVLIFLFLAINLFLGALLGYEGYQEYRSAKARTEAVISTLGRSGITVGAEIPVSAKRLRSLSLENPYADKAAFAARLLGEGASKTASGYEKDGLSLRFTEPGIAFLGSAVAVVPEKKHIAPTKEALENMGLSMRYATGRIEENAIVFTQKIDSVPLFGSHLRVTIGENNTPASVEGTWTNVTSLQGEKARGSIAAQALLAFLWEGTHEGETVTSVECGYGMLLPTDGYRTADAVPVWRITTASGSVHDFDAR